MMKYERYIHTVLVPHVIVTAIVFWGMVIAWLLGWMGFNDALLVAIIAIVVLLVHGAIAAVWSVSAAANDKTQIDAAKPGSGLDKPPTEPKPALTIDKPTTEPKPVLNVDKPPVVLRRPTEEIAKIVTLSPAPIESETPKTSETPSIPAAPSESVASASVESETPKASETPSTPAAPSESAPPASVESETPKASEMPNPPAAPSESTPPVTDKPATDPTSPKQIP